MFKSVPLISLTKHVINVIPDKDSNEKSLKTDILLCNDRAFSRQALIFQTDGPGFKLMSPKRIKMMDHQGLTVRHLTIV